MEHGSGLDAALAFSIALAAGMIAQSVARHLRIPGIVLLLAVGVLLGPDVADLIRPDAMGEALHILVGFAVAVILFEGGMNLGWRRLRRQATVIQRLITIGALVTAIGGTLVGRFVMDWDWRLAAPFGALVVVTGPTVITPLLRRIRVNHHVETVLEAEGVLIDAIGAVFAVVTLEAVLSFSTASLAEGVGDLFTRLGLGLLLGAAGGLFIALLLRYRQIVPDGFENVLTLSLVLVLFQVSNALLPESGIASVTAAGMVVGNIQTRALRDLMEFKEQLTLMFIGLLFVLLAADVRIEDVLAVGVPGLVAVACLMFVVRPLNVWISTFRTDFDTREKLFLSWLAPRGVVAAAVASLFAQTLKSAGIPGGEELRALVFMVIAATVVIQGLSGGFVASLLGLRRKVMRGWAVLGANELSLELGRLLAAAGDEVVFIDNNPSSVRVVEQAGFKVVFGNIIEERTVARAELEERRGCVALTPNEEVNLLFATTATREFRQKQIYIALRHTQQSVRPENAEKAGAQVLFGRPRDVDLWIVRVRRGLTAVEPWRLAEPPSAVEGKETQPFDFGDQLTLPLVMQRGSRSWPVGHGRPFKKGDVVHFALFTEKPAEAAATLQRHGWRRVDVGEAEEPESDAARPDLEAAVPDDVRPG